jgi:hypothetical protein
MVDEKMMQILSKAEKMPCENRKPNINTKKLSSSDFPKLKGI